MKKLKFLLSEQIYMKIWRKNMVRLAWVFVVCIRSARYSILMAGRNPVDFVTMPGHV